MAICTTCGSAVGNQARTCPTRGAPIGATINRRAYGHPPPAHPDGPGDRRPNPFLSGDWIGALLDVAAGVGVMVVIALGSLVFFDVGPESRFSPITFLAGTASLICLAFAGALTSGPGSPAETSPIRPLTLALVGFALLGLFVRRLRRSGAVAPAGVALQAVRIAVVGLGLLIIVSLLGQLNEASTGLARAGSRRRPGPAARAGYRVNLGLGVVSLLIALFIAMPPATRASYYYHPR